MNRSNRSRIFMVVEFITLNMLEVLFEQQRKTLYYIIT